MNGNGPNNRPPFDMVSMNNITFRNSNDTISFIVRSEHPNIDQFLLTIANSHKMLIASYTFIKEEFLKNLKLFLAKSKNKTIGAIVHIEKVVFFILKYRNFTYEFNFYSIFTLDFDILCNFYKSDSYTISINFYLKQE